MAVLTVWKFDRPDGAERAETVLVGLSKQELINIFDAATVSWPPERQKPKTRQLSGRLGTAAGTGWGALWGMLFGLIFFVPLLGAAVGAGLGALSGHFSNLGISRDFIDSVRQQVTPGTSALFLLSANAVIDKVKPALADLNPQLISTNLSTEQEEQLRAAFADDEPGVAASR
jgi:uncharacterized membrane protein